MSEQGRRRRRGRHPASRCPPHAGAAPQASRWANASRNLRISEDSCPPSRPLPLLRESDRPRGVGALVQWQWLASSAVHPLSRCCAAEIQQALLAVLAGEAFLADRPWSAIWWGRMRLDLASGWQLEVAIERDQLGELLWARAADGRNWEFGCQRDDWTLGPDSQIVEPVAVLQPEQREQLERLLRAAICWPPPLVTSGWMVPIGSLEPSGHTRGGRRRPAHRPVTWTGMGNRGVSPEPDRHRPRRPETDRSQAHDHDWMP